MFTGIVEALGHRRSALRRTSGATRPALRSSITTALDVGSLPLGASIAVDGVCLTVVERGAAAASRPTSAPRRWRCTTLGALRRGARVHLERPLRVGDPLGGHLVAGHVDGVGTVVAPRERGDALELEIAAPAERRARFADKGSVDASTASA